MTSTKLEVIFDFNDPAVKSAIQKIVLEVLKTQERSQHSFLVSQKATEAKMADAVKEEQAERPQMEPVFSKFLSTGDISEIRDIPDHKKIFKNYIFCTLTSLNGRTIHIEKAATRGRTSSGIMPPQYWDDELITGLTAALKEAPQRAVILTDGGRPFVISDITFLENNEWETMGRLFNSLYSKF